MTSVHTLGSMKREEVAGSTFRLMWTDQGWRWDIHAAGEPTTYAALSA